MGFVYFLDSATIHTFSFHPKVAEVNLQTVLGDCAKLLDATIPYMAPQEQCFARTSDVQSHTSGRHGSLRPPLGVAAGTLEDP